MRKFLMISACALCLTAPAEAKDRSHFERFMRSAICAAVWVGSSTEAENRGAAAMYRFYVKKNEDATSKATMYAQSAGLNEAQYRRHFARAIKEVVKTRHEDTNLYLRLFQECADEHDRGYIWD